MLTEASANKETKWPHWRERGALLAVSLAGLPLRVVVLALAYASGI